MKCMEIKYIFILLLLKTFCLNFSQSSENNNKVRYKRKIEGTTTAEPKIDLSHSTTINTNVTQSSSTTIKSKTTENQDTTTTYTGSTTTERFNNLQYTRLFTMSFRHTTSTTTAMPITGAQPSPIMQQQQFDVLSFLEGCLFTFCLGVMGIVGWKLYAVHVERSYRTI